MLAPGITDRALARTATNLARGRPELPAPIQVVWTDCAVLTLDTGTPWLYGPLERDPVLGTRALLPRRVRRGLRRVARSGVAFDAVATAHELDRTGPVRLLTPELRGGPRRVTDDVARRVLGPVPPHPVVDGAARMLDRVVRAGPRLAQVAAAALDPIVFGVVASGPLVPGAPSLWYPLAAWRW